MQRKKKHTGKLNGSQMSQANGMQSLQTDQSLEQTSHKEPLSGTFHQSCQTLLYDSFIRVLTGEGLHLLVIAGVPSPEQLKSAWEAILQEYSGLIKTEKSDSYFSLHKKIAYTEWQLSFFDSSLGYLKLQYDREIAEKIAELGYELIQDLPDRTAYLKQIYLLESEAKTLVVLLNQYHNEYKTLYPDEQVPKGERTIPDYDKELAILSKYVGFRLKKTEITVSEFCGYASLYLEEVREQKKRKQNG